MRSEQFERMRRHCERDHTAALAAGTATAFDPAKPWATAFRMAVGTESARLWWDENLHRPVLLFLTRLKSHAESIDDGTNQPALVPAPAERARREPRPRSRTPLKRQEERHSEPSTREAGTHMVTSKGQRFCDDYQTSRGCEKAAQCTLFHGCIICKNVGHGAAGHAAWQQARGAKTDGRDKRKGRGKGSK